MFEEMGIIGLEIEARRDGKIRSGYKDKDNNNRLTNTEYFLLHDAPQLIPVLGENPTEIYAVVYSDSPSVTMKADLRWYTKSTLACQSMHNAPDENGAPMGSVAAYSQVGSDAQGLTQRPFPGRPTARVRVCRYKNCPDYMKGLCSEHMFLNFVIPQYAMTAIFTLDTTSIFALMNARSALRKAHMGSVTGRIKGTVLRIYKKMVDTSFTDPKSGKTYKGPKPIVHVDVVPFHEYEARFKDQISQEDWMVLQSWRSGAHDYADQYMINRTPGNPELSGAPQGAAQLGAAQPPPPPADAGIISNEDSDRTHKDILAKPEIQALFSELSALMGVENTEDRRMNTMKHVGTEAKLLEALPKQIAKLRKDKEAKAPPKEAPAQSAKKIQAPPQESVIEHKSADQAPAPSSGPLDVDQPMF